MINRLGVCEEFVLVFWEWGLLHWFSYGLALWRCTLQGAGGGVWCKWLWPPLGSAVLLTEVYRYLWVWWQWLSLVSCPGTGSSHPPVFRKPSQKSNNHFPYVSGFHQNPTFTLPTSEISACQEAQHSSVCLRQEAGFQNSKVLEICVAWTCTDHLGDGLTALWLVPACSRNQLQDGTVVQSSW